LFAYRVTLNVLHKKFGVLEAAGIDGAYLWRMNQSQVKPSAGLVFVFR